MAIFKCKMCGGQLNVNDEKVVECEYCGCSNTLPKLDDERKINLYDRANHYRRNDDFDKASAVYEQILNEDKTDSEAYWSLLLCKYGIKYVKDSKTNQMIPTVNRMQPTSILADEDYKEVLKYADVVQRKVYEQEAHTINEIQKGINEILKNEEPFDVFICYKETDELGKRTIDSVKANELYHNLTNEGYKVFYAKLTLQAGTNYEPYIYAALHSSKVMVVLGTKKEYFEAPWVKNEWSRFLALIKKGEKKTLIPAYMNMDPYDLPDDFSHLQALSMTDLGFMPDVIRAIKKLVEFNKEPSRQEVVSNTNNKPANANENSLLERIFMFLEDGEEIKADTYIEKVLDINPRCAKAYLAKMMVTNKFKTLNELVTKNLIVNDPNMIKLNASLSNDHNFEKALKYADDRFKEELNNLQKQRYLNIANKCIETGPLYLKDFLDIEATDEKAQLLLNAYDLAFKFYILAGDFKNAKEQLAKHQDVYDGLLDNRIDMLLASITDDNEDFGDNDFPYFDSLLARVSNSETKSKIANKIDRKKESLYEKAKDLFENKGKYEDVEKAKYIFDVLARVSYKASKEYANKCEEKLIELYNEEKYQEGLLIFNPFSVKTQQLLEAEAYSELATKAEKALSIFYEVEEGYKDIDNIIVSCENFIEKSKQENAKLEAKRKKDLELYKIKKEKDAKRKKYTIIFSSLLLVVLIVASIITVNSVKKANIYKEAMSYIKEENYVEARKSLGELKRDYKDVLEQYNKIRFKGLTTGEVIKMGYLVDDYSYWLDNMRTKDETDIEWIVLDVKDNQALLLCKNVLSYYSEDYVEFQNEIIYEWKDKKDTRIDKWFTEDERAHMNYADLSNAISTGNGSSEAKNAVRLFPLSLKEFETYSAKETYGSMVKTTNIYKYMERFLKAYNAEDSTGMNLYEDYWYTRTLVEGENYPVACVSISSGEIKPIVTQAYNGFYSGFRPAVWVDIDE